MQPLTLKQSRAICNDFQFLKGNNFNILPESGKIIECITVAPFDDINKWIFVNYYAECLNAEKALQYYCGPYYDVLVICKLAPRFDMGDYCDIRTYLQQQALPFNISDYEN